LAPRKKSAPAQGAWRKISNTACRARAFVGRVSMPAGVSSFRPFHAPAMMRGFKEAVAFLKKSSAKNFCYSGALPVSPALSQTHKVFLLLFVHKKKSLT
jgi:hypothetical protein